MTEPSAASSTTSAAQLLRRIRLRHVSCFVMVAREQHVGRAAERLHLSQPAVTKTLNELESLAGARLLDRGRHGTRLTVAGEQFLRYALGITEALEAAAGALAGVVEESAPPVRLGALPTVGSALLPDALTRLRARHPQLGVQVSTGANHVLVDALRAGELDLVLGRMAEPDTMRGISFELLYAESLAVVARPGHPLTAAPAPISLAAVLDHPVVVATAGTVPRHHAEELLRRHGLRLPPGRTETLELAVAREIVRRSDAVWFAPERAPQADLDDGVLVRLDVATPGSAEPVGLLRRSMAEPSAARDDLAEILRGLALTQADGTTRSGPTGSSPGRPRYRSREDRPHHPTAAQGPEHHEGGRGDDAEHEAQQQRQVRHQRRPTV